ncbi:DUF502 domain-containing protein [Alicyclobacillus curvatus]|nr:DUF502 domain-containing protein [Alicyclobacillus curvatus]
MMGILRQIAKHFGIGLVTVLPFALVIWVVVSVFEIVDSWFGPEFDRLIGAQLPGAGFLLVLIAITLVGALTRVYISHQFLVMMDSMFSRLPIIKSLYSMFKEIVNNLLGHRRGFRRTVLVAWPDERALMLGFVTSENLSPDLDPDGDRVAVYIPNAFQFAGITAIVPRHQIRPCGLSVEEALKFSLSAGLGNGRNAATPKSPAAASAEDSAPADATEQ